MNKSHAVTWCTVAFGAAVAIAGCSGGGGGSTPGAVSSVPTVAPTAAPVPNSTGLHQTATAILTFPHGTPVGKRNYVSPNSTQVMVTVNLVNGAPPPSWVQPLTTATLAFSGAGQNCTVTNGIATCAVTIPAPPGNVNYAMQTTALVPTPSPKGTISPTPTQSPTILDYGEETIQIVQGKANQVALTLQGVVKSASLTPTNPLIANQPQIDPMILTAYDATGAPITGTAPYNSPFKFADADPDESDPVLGPYATSLQINGLPAGKQIQVAAPTDAVSIVYQGLAIGEFLLEASGKGKAGPFSASSPIDIVLQPIVLPGTFVDDSAHGGAPSDPNYNQNTLLVPNGQTVSITPSELGRTNAPFDHCNAHQSETCFSIQDAIFIYQACNQSPSPVAIFNPGPLGMTTGYTYTITGKQPGLCLQQFYDGLSPSHDQPPRGNPLVNGEIWVKVK